MEYRTFQVDLVVTSINDFLDSFAKGLPARLLLISPVYRAFSPATIHPPSLSLSLCLSSSERKRDSDRQPKQQVQQFLFDKWKALFEKRMLTVTEVKK